MSPAFSQSIRKAVFPIAGLGTRFLPVTKTVPKELLPVGEKPLIQWVVEEAKAAGIEEFCFVSAPGNTLSESHFRPVPEMEQLLKAKHDKRSLDILKPLQNIGSLTTRIQAEPLGLGHAIWCARDFVGEEPFAVLLPDDFIAADTACLQQMIETHTPTSGNMAAVIEVPPPTVSRYGILDIDATQGACVRARGIIEKPDPSEAPSNLAIVGRYLLDASIMNILAEKKLGAGREIQLTDAIAAMIPDIPFTGYRFSGQRFDCGHTAGFAAANAFQAALAP